MTRTVNNKTKYTSKIISFHSEGNISIKGKLLLPTQKSEKGIVLFHGGQAGNSQRFAFLQTALAENGITNLAFDFRGRGESSGTYQKSSLNNRLTDAKNAIELFSKYVPLNHTGIVGISLAGDMVRLLRIYSELKTIILISPVAVPEELANITPPHKANVVGKKKGTWKNSSVFSLLKNFTGQKLIIYGDKENAATPEMIESFKEAAKNYGKFIVLKNTDHNPFIIDDNVPKKTQRLQIQARKKVIDIIVKFVKETL